MLPAENQAQVQNRSPQRPYNPLVKQQQPVKPATQVVETAKEAVNIPVMEASSVFNVQRLQDRIADITLPSKGILYQDKMPNGIMKIRAMTVKDKKLIAGFRGDGTSLIEMLISRMSVECKVLPEDMLLQDRVFILLQLRAHSYGDRLAFKMTCPSCKNEFDKEISISKDFDIKYLPEDTCEPYDLELSNGIKFALKFLRAKDEKDIINYAGSKKAKTENGDPAYTYRILKHIDSINGIKVSQGNQIEALKLIESLEVADEKELDKAILAKDFGTDFAIELQCPACPRQFKGEIPWIEDFFRNL